jgi:hypothetical protein
MRKRIKIPFQQAMGMLAGYARVRIMEQIRLVAFIILYLVAFQMFVLQVPLTNALSIAGGIGMVVFGLAFFLEGLILGLMPLGERVGVKLPARVGIAIIALFGLLLGFGSTLAEPAISSLRMAGSNVTAWEAPMLYMLLERYTEALVLSIGVGVGIAVAFGMFRFYYGLSIKPFILIIIPLVLVLSVVLSFSDNLSTIIGLAWDSGAVTTGAVTVPLVLALGIGVSRAAGTTDSGGGGFGIILLASAFPILAVLTLGIVLNSSSPAPTSEEEFFSPAYRTEALKLFDSEADLLVHAFTRGSEAGRQSYYSNEEAYHSALVSIVENPEISKSLLGKMSFTDWMILKASKAERHFLTNFDKSKVEEKLKTPVTTVFKEEGSLALRAVIPLTVMLLLVLLVFLREKLRYSDEVILGIAFALIGMTLLTSGIRLGLAPLGGEVGSQLPRAFSTEEKFIDQVVIDQFDHDLLFESITPDGSRKSYFYLTQAGDIQRIEYSPDRFDPVTGRYEHIITRPPLFGPQLSMLGIFLVLLFAFGMGYGATLAEPALNALGITVEELTVGTVRRAQIVSIVALGVGVGLVIGFGRILYDLPLIWFLIPPYAVVLILTIWSEEQFTAIAWDSGGVTTGPVTVPLVLAMGLSIGGELNVVDGFGVLAMASVYPILTVLSYGLYAQMKQRRSMLKKVEEDSDE